VAEFYYAWRVVLVGVVVDGCGRLRPGLPIVGAEDALMSVFNLAGGVPGRWGVSRSSSVAKTHTSVPSVRRASHGAIAPSAARWKTLSDEALKMGK